MIRLRYHHWGAMSLFLVLLLLVMLGCGNSKPSDSVAESSSPSALMMLLPTLTAPASNLTDVSGDSLSTPVAQQRVIIKNAALALIVPDPAASVSRIALAVEAIGGWVVSSSANRSTTQSEEEVTYAAITVRVPAERLNEALGIIEAEAISMVSENVTGQDVTEEYVDLSSQLTNLQAAETQLQTIMDASGTISDVLAVYRELVNIRGQIERIQGRLRYFAEAAAFSFISVDLRQSTPVVPESEEKDSWKPLETVKQGFNALVDVLRVLADLLIILIVLVLPLVLIVGVPSWIIYRRAKRADFLKRLSQFGVARRPPGQTPSS